MKKNGLDIIHGTCVYMNGAGILLRGRSGTGKSDLALRLINDGAQLVADDQVALQIAHGNLLASAPSSLKGLLEIRGVGIIKVCSRTSAAVRLIVDLVGEKEVKRLGLTAPMVGHVGDGNFHSIVLYDPQDKEKQKKIRQYSDDLISKALELEGTITGEHGIGLQKKHYLLKEHHDNVPVMKAIKRSLDVNNIMNPGKVFDLN